MDSRSKTNSEVHYEQLTEGVWINHQERGWRNADDWLQEHIPIPDEHELSLDDLDGAVTNGKKLPFPAWHLQAACSRAKEEAFFGVRDTSTRPAVSKSDIARAKAICAECPVFRSCLETALGYVGENREEYGIWAGTSGRTRKRIWDLVDKGTEKLVDVINNICAGHGSQYEHMEVRMIPVAELQLTALKNLEEAV